MTRDPGNGPLEIRARPFPAPDGRAELHPMLIPWIIDIRDMLSEQVEYRELLFQMTRRDLMLRYKQTVMGFGWARTQQPIVRLRPAFLLAINETGSSGVADLDVHVSVPGQHADSLQTPHRETTARRAISRAH